MKKNRLIPGLLLLLLCVLSFPKALASFDFADDRFCGRFTTENLDSIIEEYELFDGWFWTTEASTLQTFHGRMDFPGWTDTSVNRLHRSAYNPRSFGCRWGANMVNRYLPGSGGYGECFGFAQFIGYLLSGDYNPQKNWDFFYSMEAAHGLRVGDIVRVEYRKNKKSFRHSAVVYAINGEETLFLQVSGGNYNRISVGQGFSDGNHLDERSQEIIASIPGIKICRSPLSQDQP